MFLELTYIEINENLRNAWLQATKSHPTSMPDIKQLRKVTVVVSKIKYILNRSGKATIVMGSSLNIEAEESYESVVFLLKGVLAGSSGPHQITKET